MSQERRRKGLRALVKQAAGAAERKQQREAAAERERVVGLLQAESDYWTQQAGRGAVLL